MVIGGLCSWVYDVFVGGIVPANVRCVVCEALYLSLRSVFVTMLEFLLTVHSD